MKIVGVHLEPGPVGWLRCWNWTTALQRRGHQVKHRPHASIQLDMDERLDDYLRDADVVIAGRMHNAQVFAALLAGRDRYKYKLIVDTDDASNITPKYNQSFADYHSGTGVSRIVQAELREADLVTVSTETLAVWARKYASREVVVVPNVIDRRLYERAVSRQKEPRHARDIRIYWGGGGGHYDDLLQVKESLLRICKERPNVKMVFSNFIPDWAASLPAFRVFMIRFAHFNAYPKVLRWLCADVALAPLVDNEFNRCKSHIKYLDYAMAGIPGVYSDLPPYESVEDGVTGLKARTSEEWYEAINGLIEDKALSSSVVAAARADVLRKWSVDDHIQRYETILREVAGRKPAEFKFLSEGVPVEAPCLTTQA